MKNFKKSTLSLILGAVASGIYIIATLISRIPAEVQEEQAPYKAAFVKLDEDIRSYDLPIDIVYKDYLEGKVFEEEEVLEDDPLEEDPFEENTFKEDLFEEDPFEENTFKEDLFEEDPFEEDPLNGDINNPEYTLSQYSYLMTGDFPYEVTSYDMLQLSEMDMLVLTKVVTCEVGYCSFEQQAATAGYCLNRLKSGIFPKTMLENVLAPKQFDVRYGEAPWPEASETTKAAIEVALSGIDYSCGAVAAYTPELSSPEGKAYFENCLEEAATIYVSVFCKLPDSK